MTDEVLRGIYQTRWRRAREALNLLDVTRDDFGTGGLGRHVPHLSVRLVVLPADPETDCIEFDKQLWTWLKRDHQQPFEGSATD